MADFYDTEYLSAGQVSIASSTHNPDNDRLRLGRELARDFQSGSFSSASSRRSGHHNNNNHSNNDDSVTLDSFDISNEAQGMSTRKIDMLQHTPTIDTQLLDQFPDFSMAGRDVAENSIEIGRGGSNNRSGPLDSLRSIEFSTQRPPPTGGGTLRSDKRLFSALSNPTLERKTSSSSIHSNASGPLQTPYRRTAGNKSKGEARAGTALGEQRLGSIINFDLSQIEISTPKNNRGRTGAAGSQGGTKITDFVSNSSGGSQSRLTDIQRSLELEEYGSDTCSISIRRRSSSGNTRFAGSPRLKQTDPDVGNKRAIRVSETKGIDLTDDLPAIVAKSRKQPATKIPQNFKSTDAFLHELGLDGNITATDMKAKLQQLKVVDPCKGSENSTLGITQQSFMLPHMSDLSELISGYPGDATGMSLNRGTFNNTKGHRIIESIPVPHDQRAVLMAMRLLQDKVASLESSKAEAEHRCLRLEAELQRSEMRIQLERQKSKVAGENLERKRSSDSAFGGSDDSDSQERVKERIKLELQMEKLRLESAVNSLHSKLDKSTRDLGTAKIALKHMQEERNSAVNSVAMAIANSEDLKASMKDLKDKVERLQLENCEQERMLGLEREGWKEREDRLRRKIKAANEAAMIAQVVMGEATKRDTATAAAAVVADKEAAGPESREQRIMEKEALREAEREQERAMMEAQVRRKNEGDEKRELERVIEQQKKLDNLIKQQLMELRPDLPLSSVRANQGFIQPAKSKMGNERVMMLPQRLRKQVTTDEVEDEAMVRGATSAGGEKVVRKENRFEQILTDDTVMSISPEGIKRIAKDINEERRKRKAAAAAVNVAAPEAVVSEDVRSKEQSRWPRSRVSTKKPNMAKPPTQPQSCEPSTGSYFTQIESGGLSTIPSGSKQAPKVGKIERLDKGKGVEELGVTPLTSGPVYVKAQSPDAISQSQTQKPAKRTRLVKKVVYYYDEDLTINIPIEEEVEEEYEDEGVLGDEIMQQDKQENKRFGSEELTVEFGEGLIQDHAHTIAPPPIPAKIPFDIPETATGDPTTLPERVQRVNHLAAHDPNQCTVCHRENNIRTKEEEQRNANPLADIDNSMAIPAPSLEKASKKKASGGVINRYEEEPTPRPSQAPRRQLSKIVRQLQDEFAHLKLNYQTKADEFMGLDPTIGKKRRKTLTNEMSELVTEMDYKCDQIYALYDVNEEFTEGSGHEEGFETEENSIEDRESEQGRAVKSYEDEYDLTGFTIPEVSILDDSTEVDHSENEDSGSR